MFKNRIEAGELLLDYVKEHNLTCDYLFGCIRGGIEVAFPLSEGLKKEIFPLFVHKIPSSINEEFAIGAVSIDGVYALNEYAEKEDDAYLKQIVDKTVELLKERAKIYGKDFNYQNLKDQIVFVVDDGIATGETLYAGVKSILQYKPKEVYVLVPVSSYEGFVKLSEISKVIALTIDKYFYAVSQYYEYFSQLDDSEVKKYIDISKNI